MSFFTPAWLEQEVRDAVKEFNIIRWGGVQGRVESAREVTGRFRIAIAYSEVRDGFPEDYSKFEHDLREELTQKFSGLAGLPVEVVFSPGAAEGDSD